MEDAILKELVRDVKESAGEEIDFVRLTGSAMATVQRANILRGNGNKKREIVIAVFKLLAHSSNLFSASQIAEIEVFISDVLPSLITAIKEMAVLVGNIVDKKFCCF